MVSDVYGSTLTDTKGRQLHDGCALDAAFRLLAGEWTAHLIKVLSDGEARHADLLRRLDGVSSKVLTDRLRLLEREGMLSRTETAGSSPKVTYALTARGERFHLAVAAMEAALYGD